MKFPKISASLAATLGSLAGAGAVALPSAIFVMTLGLLWPSDANLLAKILAPFIGAVAMFLFGFWYYLPAALVFGGLAHIFLKRVGYSSRSAYLCAGPVLGLAIAMITHLIAPDIIGGIFAETWSGYTYVAAFAFGGLVLTGVFWNIRRPDRPWDDLKDRRLAGELV